MSSLRVVGGTSRPLLSRRKALTAAVGVGATVAMASVAYAAAANEDTSNLKIQGPLVINVRDLESGLLEIFTAGRRIAVKNKDLAVQLARAAVEG